LRAARMFIEPAEQVVDGVLALQCFVG
jgi:hypothetical protein